MSDSTVTVIQGNALRLLPKLPAKHFRLCVTSPPYWGLRDYGVPPCLWPAVSFCPMPGLPPLHVPAHRDRLGREADLWTYVAHLVAIFREVRPLLTDDGTLWLNLGDSYSSGGRKSYDRAFNIGNRGTQGMDRPKSGLPPKNLCGVPWRVAFALQADGWILRSDIIWAKPNPMPESVTDRPTRSHEYLFFFSKSKSYFYDAQAIAEPLAPSSIIRLAQPNLARQRGSDRVPGKTNGPMKAVGPRFGGTKYGSHPGSEHRTKSGRVWLHGNGRRNSRDVWIIGTRPFKEAHFATFPPQLVEPCVKAGSRPGDSIIDIFAGSGTTGTVGLRLRRATTLIDLNPQYAAMARRRCAASEAGAGVVARRAKSPASSFIQRSRRGGLAVMPHHIL